MLTPTKFDNSTLQIEKKSKYPQTEAGLNKLWYIYGVE